MDRKKLEQIKDPAIREEIEKLYKLDTGGLTDEQKKWVREKFTKPEDFNNLRVILGIISDEEAGLFIRRDIDSVPEGERYEFQDRLNKSVREILKNVLANLAVLTRNDIQNEAIDVALKEQQGKELLEEVSRENKEYKELEKKGSGVNT